MISSSSPCRLLRRGLSRACLEGGRDTHTMNIVVVLNFIVFVVSAIVAGRWSPPVRERPPLSSQNSISACRRNTVAGTHNGRACFADERVAVRRRRASHQRLVPDGSNKCLSQAPAGRMNRSRQNENNETKTCNEENPRPNVGELTRLQSHNKTKADCCRCRLVIVR